MLLLLIIARTADLLSTFARDPRLQRELNPVVRLLGWRKSVVLNLLLFIAYPFLPPKFVLVLILMSLAATIWNALGIIRDAYRIKT